MKNLIIIILASTVFMGACDSDKDRILFDPENGQTLVSFASTNADLAILINDSGSADIQVNVSTRSANDRVFTISVDPSSSADPSYYSVPGEVLIPADSYQGNFTITGTDPEGIQIPAELLILSLQGAESDVIANVLSVNVFITCPVDPGFFTGQYMVEQITPTIFGLDTFDPDGGGVLLTLYDSSNSEAETGVVLSSDTQRVFEAFYVASEGFDNELPYIMDFVCEEVVFASDQVTGLACGGNSILLGPALGDNGTYDSLDDSSFDLIFQDDITDACGQGAPEVTLRWTKQ